MSLNADKKFKQHIFDDSKLVRTTGKEGWGWFSDFLPTGADGIDEAKLIGGFQDVATLLNCLTGQSAAQSPGQRHFHSSKQHKHEEACPTLTPFNISCSKADGTLISPSKTTKDGSHESHTVPVTTDYDTGMHASLIYRKCNSLPRSRVPKIFVNNLHNFSRSPEKNLNSLHKSRVPPACCEAHTAEGCHTESKCCKTLLASPSNSRDLPPVQVEVCLACSNIAHTGQECQHGGVPKRSKSFSTVSYIAAGVSPAGECQCPIARSPCTTIASRSKSCASDPPKTALSSSCPYTTTTTPVVFSKNTKNYDRGELFLLWRNFMVHVFLMWGGDPWRPSLLCGPQLAVQLIKILIVSRNQQMDFICQWRVIIYINTWTETVNMNIFFSTWDR